MGIIEFVRDAGESLLKLEPRGGIDSDAIEKRVRSLKLDIDELRITVSGDCAVIRGIAGNQAAKEKAVLAVGNIKGIASVDDRIILEDADFSRGHYYTVASGDTLTTIANAYYGDPLKQHLLFMGNQPLLTDPARIYPGQKIRIPPLNETVTG